MEAWADCLAGDYLDERVYNEYMPRRMELTKERMLSKVRISPTGCWEWQGALDGKGYGVIHVRAISHSPIRAHRAAAFLWNNVPLDSTITDRHTCDNPICINPEHILPGTTADNIRDCV